MDLKHSSFEQLLSLVNNLPEDKREILKEALDKKPTSVRKKGAASDLSTLLLNGPVMSDKQYKAYKQNRKKFQIWRKK
jgi:hypothetical protein